MRLIAFLLIILSLTLPAMAHDPEEHVGEEAEATIVSRPDDHAPIGVMGDHRHKEGEWMASYRFRYMNMDGNLNGSSSVSEATVLGRYMISPVEMDMSSHMVGLMYAPSDRVTVSLMLPYMSKSMKHVTRAGTNFTTSSSGLGDIKAAALIGLWENEKHNLHLNAGLSLPTGTIDARDTTPAGPDSLLPYPMQLGSGTLDLMPGLTYSGHTEDWSWGAQALATIRTGSNSNGYRLGHAGDFSLWGARKWNDNVSSSLRLNALAWGDISGRDARLNPAMIATADPKLRAGSRLDLLLGLNGNFGNGHRLAIEGGVPIAQSLDGPQLKTKFVITGGWQFSF